MEPGIPVSKQFHLVPLSFTPFSSRETAQWQTQMTLPCLLSKYREAIQRGVPGRCRLGYVQEAGDTLLCTSSHSMWWAPQQGGHSDVFLRWGLACELKGFIAGEQDRGWGNNYKRYRQSLSCEQKKHILHFSPLTQNFGARLISLDSSCLCCNWAITLVSLYTHKQTIPRSNVVIFWINRIIFWIMTSGWAEPCLTNACYSSLTIKGAYMTT